LCWATFLFSKARLSLFIGSIPISFNATHVICNSNSVAEGVRTSYTPNNLT